jgi:signal transduction histidine kinase
LHEHISASHLDTRWRNPVMAAAVTAVLGLGIFDVVTDTQFSHAAVYLLPVVAVTILTSSRRGLILAALSASAWVIADVLTARDPHQPSLLNALGDEALRIIAFGTVVVVLATLRDALAEARAADLRMREFLSEAAHQLRTPIASLSACAETLILSGTTVEQERMLATLATEAQRIGRLTNSLLQIARLDQGERGAKRPVDLSALCLAEVEITRRRTLGTLDVTYTSGLPERRAIIVDPDATREALANLLDNARRHARHRIEVQVESSARQVRISVTDDGPGLPPGADERAFERFRSLDGKGGTGLGLPIARAYIERQGGQLRYRDGRFVITLPVEASSGDASTVSDGRRKTEPGATEPPAHPHPRTGRQSSSHASKLSR